MTHEYTLLVAGIVLPGGDEPDATAIAWAAGIVLAVGSDEAVRAISRGDSLLVDLAGATVVPSGRDVGTVWPTHGRLEVGGAADLCVLDRDPRQTGPPVRVLARFRDGRLASGTVPGLSHHVDH